MNSNILTVIHLVCCLLAIAAGMKLLPELFAGQMIPKWFIAFFRCSLAASITGLLLSFPFHHSHRICWVAMSSVYVSGVAILAGCVFHLAGIWRSICAFCIPIVLCLNILLVSVQAFRIIPVLRVLSPTQSGPEFLIMQFSILIFFTALGAIAARRFRGRTSHP